MRAVLAIFSSGLPAPPHSLLAWLGGLLLCTAIAQTGLERPGESGSETVTAWRQLLDESRLLAVDEKLQAINQLFNRRLRSTTDQAVWGLPDYWATPFEFMRQSQGDCEDFAIAKYFSLLMLGVPPEKLRLIYVRARFGSSSSGNSEAHMVLGYYADPAGEPLILDNLVNIIRPAASRPDLSPVFSFNTQGLWVPGSAKPASADPTARLSRWRDLLSRMKAEGVQL